MWQPTTLDPNKLSPTGPQSLNFKALTKPWATKPGRQTNTPNTLKH